MHSGIASQADMFVLALHLWAFSAHAGGGPSPQNDQSVLLWRSTPTPSKAPGSFMPSADERIADAVAVFSLSIIDRVCLARCCGTDLPTAWYPTR